MRRIDRSLEEKRALATNAKQILDDPAFAAALETMEMRLINALIQSKTEEESRDLVAKLKCLSQIAAELAIEINDYRMAGASARGSRPG